LRIIAGRFKGRRLQASGYRTLRPTSERVREAVFDVLGPRVVGSDVLDLCAGTGALGFESLSRGAAEVVFVEKNPRTADSIRRNAEALGVEEKVSVCVCEAERALKMLSASQCTFDIVFFDPPYKSGLISRLCSLSELRHVMHSGSLLVIESGDCQDRECLSSVFYKNFERNYGDTLVQMFHLNQEV
jgi:16S rRNA (guanine(966)-N(2))-methyltransferase RsmD